jgi:Na+-translocating ferredoxin:NAD+ oxidoreductase subunit B
VPARELYRLPLADRIDAALPQTQCTRCGWPDCRAYAQAIADGQAQIDQCPPGGAEGIARLAAITGRAPMPLNPVHGSEGPRQMMFIDEAWCIGCTLCIDACPVDCIVGAPKVMHTIIEDLCTGCELCLPACPVDCIAVEPATPGRTGWDAWSPAQAEQARQRYAARRERMQRREVPDPPAAAPDPKRAVIDAALQRARDQRNAKTR